MGYVAVRGGTEAIERSIERLRYERLRKGLGPGAAAIEAGMRGLVDQVMSEASLYSEAVTACAIRQAEGSPEEAVFLVRAFRSTLPRRHYSLEIASRSMIVERRISATFKDVPGGQVLGASCDYTHRLISAEEKGEEDRRSWIAGYLSGLEAEADDCSSMLAEGRLPKVVDVLRAEGLMRECPPLDEEPRDVTQTALEFPSRRSERLQVLSRGQTGAVTALGYASLRCFGALHPTVAELRVGRLPVLVPDPSSEGDAEEAYYVGEIKVTEVETLMPVAVPKGQGRAEIEFELGYGLCFGQNETKAIAMSILEQGLELEDKRFPTQDEEFVLLHVDSVEATGFISHLKLPHYVTFQSKLDSARKTKAGGA